MLPFSLKLNKKERVSLQKALTIAEKLGDLIKSKRIIALLMLNAQNSISCIGDVLQVSTETARSWLKSYLLDNIAGLNSKRSPGRPSKLTKAQKKSLANIIDEGPEKSGFPGGCWRTPMLQHLIKEKFNVFFNAHYISELLKNMGYSYQKAKFVADRKNEDDRQSWLSTKWAEIMKIAAEKNSYVLFGDEASFPQWGTLSFTWSKIGVQPIVKTTGNRKSYKVFGLIDYFTGKFFSKGYIGKLNGIAYVDFLKEVLSKTRKHIILVQDGAPYHKGAIVNDFFNKHADRITVFKLPSYSPDYNPIEMLWKKIKQTGTHMTYFPTFDSLTEKVNEMLDLFADAKNEVLSLFGLYDNLHAALNIVSIAACQKHYLRDYR